MTQRKTAQRAAMLKVRRFNQLHRVAGQFTQVPGVKHTPQGKMTPNKALMWRADGTCYHATKGRRKEFDKAQTNG